MHDWDSYNPHEKATILSSEGDFINGLEYYGRRWVLYAYKRELWEVTYNPENNEIERVEILDKRRAGMYCSEVSIDNILK